MSDSEELAKLRADLEVLERYECTEAAKANVRDKIAKLEAAADPWRDAREAIPLHIESGGHKVKEVARYARHLEDEGVGQQMKIAGLQDENARLTERVAELGALTGNMFEVFEVDKEASSPGTDSYTVVETARISLTDMPPPFEDPIVGIEPVLDPARVLATARHTLKDSDDSMHGSISYLLWCHVKESQDAKPYPLKKGGE